MLQTNDVELIDLQTSVCWEKRVIFKYFCYSFCLIEALWKQIHSKETEDKGAAGNLVSLF